jgi:anti-anti-sigma regulatory factor
MAQGENPPGLLSKVAKFVRNPTKDWSELNQEETEQDNGYSKEALKGMIERKRQNDFVRKREFDHLRKLRRRDPMANPDQAGRPSFFQSSLTSNLDERAETLKKIDEIEAQMSRQWWKGKQEDGSVRAGVAPAPSSSSAPLPSSGSPDSQPSVVTRGSADSRFEQTEASGLNLNSQWRGEAPGEYAPTQTSDAIPPASGPTGGQNYRPASRGQPLSAQASRGPVGAGFSTNRLFAVELADSLTDPDLEEAAIRFANGDDAGAEEGLLAALQSENLRPEAAEAWMSALFDLYRATGQQARFENVALEFASRFGRSAPAWFSTPELLSRKSALPANLGAKPKTAGSEAAWSSPALLTRESLLELQTVLKRNISPALLDWSALSDIAPDALASLANLFAVLCNMPIQLVFRGYESLERTLRAVTPSGDRSVKPVNWQLRMDALRVMRLQDEFELVALEYCVTFEVSPPSWQETRSSCELEGFGLGGNTAPGEMEDDPRSGWTDPGLAMTDMGGLEGDPPALVELSGEIVGDAADALARLEAGMEGATRMVISCARLIRVDFSAAGSILNWVAQQQARGCQVQFRDVNRIVAAFFNVIGINEHARVVPRSA